MARSAGPETRPARTTSRHACAEPTCHASPRSRPGRRETSADRATIACRSRAPRPKPGGQPRGRSLTRTWSSPGTPQLVPATQGQRLGEVALGILRVAAPRSAIVRATRRDRSNPLPVRPNTSTASARSRSAPSVRDATRRATEPERCALHAAPVSFERSCWRSRAASTRSRTPADDSARSRPSNSCRETRGTSNRMSMRSRSGPDKRARYPAIDCGVHEQISPGTSARPHGHGLAAAIKVHRAGTPPSLAVSRSRRGHPRVVAADPRAHPDGTP